MFKWPVCLVRVAWFASMACSLVNMPGLMLVVRPLLRLLALAFLLNGRCVLVDSLLFLKLPMVGSLALPHWLCLKKCGVWCMLEVVAFVLRRSGCVLPCLAGACILICCLPPNLRFFFSLAKVWCLDLVYLSRLSCPCLWFLLGFAWDRQLDGSGLILIQVAVWIFLPPVTSVSVSMLLETLGVLGACIVTWHLSDGMFSLTACMMLLDVFVG